MRTRHLQQAIALAAQVRRPRLLALGLIVLLHAVGLWWLRDDLQGRARPARPEPARVALRLLPLPLRLPAERPPTEPQPPTPAARRPLASPAAPRSSRSEAATPAAPPLRFEAITASPAAPAAPDAPAAVGTPPRPGALDLRLPRAASAPPTPADLARSDPRSNTAGTHSFGERLGAALGNDDRIVEQAMNDGRIRVRRGAGCVELHPARSAQLDPFNEATRPTPRAAKACD